MTVTKLDVSKFSPWTWYVFNESTMQFVVDPVLDSAQTKDEATRECQRWLLAEANKSAGDTEWESQLDSTILDNAAQELNYGTYAKLNGQFDWSVHVVNVDEYKAFIEGGK